MIGLCPAIFYWMLRGEKVPAQAEPQPAPDLGEPQREARPAAADGR
jgi:hypothetical protein